LPLETGQAGTLFGDPRFAAVQLLNQGRLGDHRSLLPPFCFRLALLIGAR